MKRTFVILLAATSACADVPPAPQTSGDLVGTATVWPGLVETVRMEPASPRTGETIHITATLRNTGPLTTPPIEVSICGLGLRGALALEHPSVQCAGYSMSTSLAPGDTVSDRVVRIVRSPPGTYRLEIQHVRSATTWVPLTVVVR
jgi:hypothetical protein